MENLIDFAFKSKYEKVKKLRSRLEKMKGIIDWDKFLPLFPEKKAGPGRPAYDKAFMVKTLFLQSWYGLSDEELEYQIHNRLDFQNFLDCPENVPDYSTVWRFREELADGDTIDKLWAELQKQMDEKHIKIEKGVIQDASFIQADPGKKHSGMERRGREAKTSRSKDGTWTQKNNKSYFGFKLHTKIQRGSKLIKEVALTTAKTHDSEIDMANPEEIVYRDKAYTGVKTKAKGNGSMKRGKLTPKEKLRNQRITRKRSQGEHPYGTIQRSFNGGRTKLTTIPRVFIQQVIVCAAYNIHRLQFLLST